MNTFLSNYCSSPIICFNLKKQNKKTIRIMKAFQINKFNKFMTLPKLNNKNYVATCAWSNYPELGSKFLFQIIVKWSQYVKQLVRLYAIYVNTKFILKNLIKIIKSKIQKKLKIKNSQKNSDNLRSVCCLIFIIHTHKYGQS